MSQRERYLALAVAVVIGLFGAQYMFSTVMGTLREKQDAIETAQRELDDIQKTETSGKIAARKMEALASKSLPKDQETLIAQYRDWLTELGKDVEMKDIKVSVPTTPIKQTDAYSAYNFTLQGLCRTDKAIDLMAKFYDKDYLHSIRNLKLTLTKEPNIVSVTLDSQALALAVASPKQEPSPESSGRLAMSVDEYKSAILERNPFSPPNKPPKLKTSKSHEITRGSSWSLALEAEDPESHGVNFELLSAELPSGLKFRNGKFDWKPEENGEFEVPVKAADDGWPSKSIEEKLVFKVVDPPKEEPVVEKPKFDVATQAFVSAMLGGRRGAEVWIRSKTDGELIELRKGSNFELGSIKATVVDINLSEDFVELETDGRHWMLGMDVSLADAYEKSQID